jgi:rhodanese-related sulfurtransferase
MLNKKIVLFIYPFFIVIIVLFFYFLFFYAPIKDNSELFPFENNDVINTLHSPEISQEILDQYGITIDAIEEKKDNYDNVYYIDGREPEEYAATPKEDAVHVRAHDIKDVSVILQCLNISQDQLNKSLVVVFCHNGTRSSEVVSKINLPNVKFLIDGVGVLAQDIKIAGSVLPSRIQDHDFAISIEDAIELIEDGAFLIDGRLLMEEDNLFDNAFEFRSAQLSTED